VFGRESNGLSNPDLKLCDQMTFIPSHPNYRSLNLAQAVMVIAYSLFTQKGATKSIHKDVETVSKADLNDLFKYLAPAMLELGYNPGEGRNMNRVLNTFRGIFKRSGLMQSEVNMFKSVSRRIRQREAYLQKKLSAKQEPVRA